MSENHTCYTAAQIALALGRKRQAVQRALGGVAATSSIVVSGNVASAWTFAALPARIQAELSQAASARGYRDAEALLNAPAEQWQPPVSLQQVRPQFVSRATKLRAAMAAPIAQQHTLSTIELAELGLREFSREFGYTISAKQWNRLFDRAIFRDRGFNQWQRLELYLDDAAFQQPIAKIATVASIFDHSALADTLATLENTQAATLDDRAHIFHGAFVHYEALIANCSKSSERHAAKASLIAHLFSAVPSLAKTVDGLRRTFELRYKQWCESGKTFASLTDRRPINSGRSRSELCDDCKRTLITLAVAHDGNESLAYRLARRGGLLCDACQAGHSFNPRVNKSAVPKTVRAEITPLVDSVLPLHRGPKEDKMRGPYISRDWSDVLPGDWFSADDITWNHYFRHTHTDGRIEVMRGECLLMIDLRTGYPLDFSLIAGKYNSEHIRGLMLRVNDRVGLPFRGYYFERGVWSSRLVNGASRNRSDTPWRDTQRGFDEHGLALDVRHATTPRAKTIEGLIRIIQERMRSIPGFVGFNERTDKRERVQKLLSSARAGNEDALQALPSMDEWRNTIRATLHEFARDPQNGKMLAGATPEEMWNEQLAKRPLKQLPESARFILATHCLPVRVRQEGIVLTIRGQRMLYANEDTGRLIGRDVLAHYNIECPELLTVCDMKRQNFFSVRRVELPAMSATDEQFAAVNAQIKGHRAAAKSLYGDIRHGMVATIARDSEHDAATRELGQLHNAAVKEQKAAKSETTRKLRKIQSEAAAMGVAVPVSVRNPDRVIRALEMEQRARAKIAQEEQQA